jgi:hypothetical protein
MCYYAAKFRSPQSMVEHGLCERNATSHFVSFHIIKALDGGWGSTANGRGEFMAFFLSLITQTTRSVGSDVLV